MIRVLILFVLLIGQAQADICAQTGVFICEDFTNPADLVGTLHAGNSTPVVEDGLLKFTIPSQSGANAGGFFLISNFPAVGEGENLYLAYRIRASKVITTWPVRKHFVLWRGSSSCTDLEMVNAYKWGNAPWLQVNHACGSQTFNIPHESNPSNHIFQYAAGEGAHRCTYQSTNSGDGQDCAFSEDDVWEDFYVEIEIGSYGSADSRVVFWQKKGALGTWRKYLEQDAATIYGSGIGYHNIQLTVYMTGKNAAEIHDPEYVDYDYLVMSTSPMDKSVLDNHVYPGAVDPPPETPRVDQRAKVCFGGACIWVVSPAPEVVAPIEGTPSWVANMTPGEWEVISLNTMSDVDPNDDPEINPNYPSNSPWYGGSGGQNCVIACWNGGAFASEHGTYGSLLTFGGGHTGYHGSEVYAFDMETRLWSRVTDPFPGPFLDWTDSDIATPDGVTTGLYTDGSPLPPHTYSGVGYIPSTNEFYVARGIMDVMMGTDAANIPRVYFLDLDTGVWRYTSLYTIQSGPGIYAGATTYDAERDKIYMIPSYNNAMIVHNVTDGTFDYGYSMSSIPIDTNAAIDPDNDLLMIPSWRACSSSCPIYIRDLLNLSTNNSVVIQNGTPPTRAGAQGFEWSVKLGGFVYNYGDCIHLLTKDNADRTDRNWTWQTPVCGGVTPQTTTNSTGTYNRFRLAKYGDEEIAIVVNRNDGPVYGMRLP